MSKAKVVLDLGHSLWKGKSATGAEFMMPHAIVPISKAQYQDALARAKNDMPKDIVKIQGHYYALGKSAESFGNIQTYKGAERYKASYYGVAAMGMISAMYNASKLEVEVFASHPPSHTQYTDELLDSVFAHDVWEVENGERQLSIEVTYGNVFDEITGGIMNVMLNEDGAHYARPELKRGKIAGIDIGGGTTDFSEVLDGQLNPLSPHSEGIGIMNVIQDFELAFRNRYKEETRGLMALDTAKVRNAIVTGQYSGGGRVYDCFQEASQARNKLLNRVLQVFQNRYGGAFNYDAILLTGGGSALMFEAIVDALNHDNIILADDIDSLHFANVRGGLKLWRLYEHMGVG